MMTLEELHYRFSTDDECKAYLVSMRWPNGVRCPRCSSEKVHKLGRPWNWQCKQCTKKGYRFSPLVGTIFENTNIPLRTWFHVIYLMCQSKKGMSALQIHRTIGTGSYRSAWYMCHRIRAAMQGMMSGGGGNRLTGIVEVDETFVGGKLRNMHPAKRRAAHAKPYQGKSPVIGAIGRKGNVVAQVVDHIDGATLVDFVRQTVDEKVDLVATDQHLGYQYLPAMGYRHDTVNHEQGEYVRGIVHTGNIDSFWSLLKRGIMGSFHHVSREFLPLYLNEFSFRYNNRKNPDMFRDVIAGC